ncbi:MAG TPA: hypothetical protein VFK31_09500 [Rhodanobacteraceae bacterium]|nr:hypothetical protein [Rhodanobacteraceae bacterium]
MLAGDIKFEVTCHSSVLDEFSPDLRRTLYRKPEAGEQDELPLSDSDGLTARKLPHLKPLAWDEDFPGYRLTIKDFNGFNEDATLPCVKLSKFNFEAQDGGSVHITFRASCELDADEAGTLCSLIQEAATITLVPPEPVEAAESGQEDLEAA